MKLKFVMEKLERSLGKEGREMMERIIFQDDRQEKSKEIISGEAVSRKSRKIFSGSLDDIRDKLTGG